MTTRRKGTKKNVFASVEIHDDYVQLYCGGCQQMKPRDDFHRHSGRKSGRNSRCKLCAAEYGTNYYLARTEHVILTSMSNRRKRVPSVVVKDDDVVRRHLSLRLREARNRSCTRNLLCTITIEDLLALYVKQKGLCAVSGHWMTLLSTRRCDPEALSIDRIDNTHGYESDNIRLVTARVNYAIGPEGLDTYLDLCREILRYRGELS